ncbi:hypothetical protein ACFRSX_26095 [Streptomyces goshikiensis]|uniref:hypothetical protein n=1 Tax=Streptomyces TaxID=1883 RepID=UPI000C26DE3D|nr:MULTISPECIES: hypothetical protein [unclassified Streptomyces]MBP0937648.1 hypothetical protein [Streptomyces sp. KCTC 0041BP]PJN20074.1 hypothetical protein CG724_07745 [Streptomyces sp. CB02120-2]
MARTTTRTRTCSRTSTRTRAAFAPRGGRLAGAALALFVTAGLTSCSAAKAEQSAPAVTRFTQNGVTVTLAVAGWKDDKGSLKATFTPTEAGYHLYSTDLPADGVEGVGRPTSVTVAGGLSADGPASVDAEVLRINLPGVESKVPVYPDGPVTLTLPVRAEGEGEGGASTGTAKALISYASCNAEEGCNIPVLDRPVILNVTGKTLTFP